MSGRRIDVTATQAAASMLATLTGAIAASGLGIGGTIIGAAFMSLASTVGAAVYKHYIGRSNERLRAAASNLPARARGGRFDAAAAMVRRHWVRDPAETTPVRRYGRPARAAGATAADRTTAPSAAAPDGAETEVLPTLMGLSDWRQDPRDRSSEPETAHDLGSPAEASPAGNGISAQDEDATRTWFRPGTGTPAGPGHAAGTGPSGSQAPRTKTTSTQHGSRRKWLMLAAAALGVFVITMGVITAFEAIAGKPLDAVVWHHKGSGTTLGGLVKKSPSSHRPSTGPSPTGSVRPSTTPSNSTSTPSSSTGPSSSASPGSSPPASSGAGASSAPAAQTNGAASPGPLAAGMRRAGPGYPRILPLS